MKKIHFIALLVLPLLFLLLIQSCRKFVGLNHRNPNELTEIFNTPIDFYGIVLDENQKPVAGASVDYSIVTEYKFQSPKFEKGIVTGTDGRFAITGKKGASMFVAVSHSKYYKTATSKQTFRFDKNPYDIPQQELPSKNTPFPFLLRKKGNTEPLVHAQSGSISVPFDGKPIHIEFRNGHPKIAENGDLRIECISEQQNLSNSETRIFPWKCKLSVLGGGLIEQIDEYIFQAPDDGYTEHVIVNMWNSSDKDWSDSIDKRYFLLLPDKKYARINFRITAIGQYIVIDAYFNPSGSRNLEYDSANEIIAH